MIVFFIKGIIRRIKYFFLGIHHKEVKRYVSYFIEPDFELIRSGNTYQLIFNDKYGYNKTDFQPQFYYDYFSNAWIVLAEGVTFKSHTNPCFELICEWRGYTLKNNIGEGDIVLDIGASTGLITTFLAKKVGKTGKVIALEPNSEILKILNRNLKINRLTNVEVIAKGFYTKSGVFGFDTQKMCLVEIDSQNNFPKVETISLFDILSLTKIDEKKLKLIKMDIEGAELEVANQLGDFISRNPATMAAIAAYHKVDGVQTAETLADIFKTKFSNLDFKTDFHYHLTSYVSA